MNQIGLVLQGGGMRGVYTSGALDFFMEQNLYFPYVIAVSAGACNGLTYLCRQKGLGKKMHIDYLHDPNYVSFRNLLFKKSIFGYDYIFDEIPNKHHPIDLDTFHACQEKLVVVATDCMTGQSVYLDQHTCEQIVTAIRASCSLPFVSSIVELNGMKLLDGGISDPIPVKQSIKDGNDLNVIVLTETPETMKRPPNLKWLAKTMYRGYHDLVASIFDSYKVYNETLEHIRQLESDKKAIVIRPGRAIRTKMVERDKRKLTELYNQGYEDAQKSLHAVLNWV